MKTAIFGLAGSGKTELFQALTGPRTTLNERAMVKVPEPRLEPLIRYFKPRKVTHTEIEYLDIRGGGGKSSSLGQRLLNEIRAYDCLVAVLDHFSGLADPREQLKSIETDLIIADLAVVEKRLEKIEQDKKKAKHLVDAKEEQLLQQVQDRLEQDAPLRADSELSQAPELKGFCFLSAKPILYVWNCDEQKLGTGGLPRPGPGEAHLEISATLEKELAELEDPEEQQAFLEDLGLEESALNRIIAQTYDLLGLITFLTGGEKEVRSWPLRSGAKAPEAAGVIHSDIQKGFIRAEVLAWSDFEDLQDFKKAKEKGVLRLEGKEYLVKDGDIITFRFNV